MSTELGPTLDLHLRDGTAVRIRPVFAEDKARLEAGLQQLSERSRWLRFFSPIRRLSHSQLRYLTEIDHVNHMAWGAVDPDDPSERGLGVARYIRLADEPEVAEAAVTVVDSHQGRGLGSLLLQLLSRSAAEHGIRSFRAYMLSGNEAMLHLLRRLGASLTVHHEPGMLRVDVPVLQEPPTRVDPALVLLTAVARGEV